MPGGDRTGPAGQGPGTGRGMGRGCGQAAAGQNRSASLSRGYCVCPACGARVSHQLGVPCSSAICKKCGTKMVRE